MAVKIEEWDEHVSYARQLEQATGPVILFNHFSIDPADVDQFLEVWREAAAFMKRQPGYISAQLHRGVAGSGAFVNVAAWESAAAMAAATRAPEFQAVNGRYAIDAVARPHLLEKVAVPGICVA